MTRSGNNFLADNQNIGTSAEAVAMGDCAAGSQFVVVKNADATNYCTLYADGASGAKPLGKLYPGQFACFLLSETVTLGAKANTAGILLEKLIIEDVSVGSLAVYNPQPPSAGYSTASVSVVATIGSSVLVFSASSTEAIASAGQLTSRGIVDLDSEPAWPDDKLNGGNAFGTVMLLNPDATTPGQLLEVTSGAAYGTVPVNNGAAIIPFNDATQQTELYALTAHNEAVVATRKTI